MQKAPELDRIVLSRTVALFRAGFGRFILPTLLVTVPGYAMQAYAMHVQPDLLSLAEPSRPRIALFLIAAVKFISSTFAGGMVTSITCDLIAGRRPSVRDALDRVGGRIMRLLLVSVTFSMALAAGCCTLGVLSVVFGARWFAVTAIALCESQPGGRAFQRSDDLTLGFRDRLALLFLMTIAPLCIIQSIAELFLLEEFGVYAAMAFGIPFSCFSIGLSNVLFTTVYFELRRAKENPNLTDLYEEEPPPEPSDDDFA